MQLPQMYHLKTSNISVILSKNIYIGAESDDRAHLDHELDLLIIDLFQKKDGY
jgi:hypothetical protein